MVPPRVVLPVAALAACALHSSSKPGPIAEIPVFAANDARVADAGFVTQTLRLSEERGGTRYTLMAFGTGEMLTLGAMVQGAFRGTVEWTLGRRTLSLPFDAADPGRPATVAVHGGGGPIAAAGASFRGTAWTNVEVPMAWAGDGTALQLRFVPEGGGGALVLPDAGHHYVVHLQPR